MTSETKNTPMERLLLQQHQSLLLRAVVSQATHRAINTVIVAFTLINLMIGHAFPYAPLVPVCVATLVACLWYFDQRLLSTRLIALEKALAKKGTTEFEEPDPYITYRFESSMSARRFWVLRFEPLLWLAVVIINALLSAFMNSSVS
jgi:hypothetical protein